MCHHSLPLMNSCSKTERDIFIMQAMLLNNCFSLTYCSGCQVYKYVWRLKLSPQTTSMRPLGSYVACCLGLKIQNVPLMRSVL